MLRRSILPGASLILWALERLTFIRVLEIARFVSFFFGHDVIWLGTSHVVGFEQSLGSGCFPCSLVWTYWHVSLKCQPSFSFSICSIGLDVLRALKYEVGNENKLARKLRTVSGNRSYLPRASILFIASHFNYQAIYEQEAFFSKKKNIMTRTNQQPSSNLNHVSWASFVKTEEQLSKGHKQLPQLGCATTKRLIGNNLSIFVGSKPSQPKTSLRHAGSKCQMSLSVEDLVSLMKTTCEYISYQVTTSPDGTVEKCLKSALLEWLNFLCFWISVRGETYKLLHCFILSNSNFYSLWV